MSHHHAHKSNKSKAPAHHKGHSFLHDAEESAKNFYNKDLKPVLLHPIDALEHGAVATGKGIKFAGKEVVEGIRYFEKEDLPSASTFVAGEFGFVILAGIGLYVAFRSGLL
jgi:hypothetical protein